MLLGSRIIPGCLHTDNRTACDWGWHGFFAYGCHNVVVVLDTRTIQVIQTVQEHTSPICQVKWMQEDFYHDEHTSYNLTLAAGNTTGYIMIWDIRTGIMRNEFCELNRVPLSMEWLKGYDVSHDLLLVLYSPNILILWNSDTGVSLWKKVFAESIMSVSIDPFNVNHMTVMSSDWIMLIKDFSISHAPSDKGRKFYMSSNATSNPSQSSAGGGHVTPINKSTPSKSTFQKVKSWAGDLRGRDTEGVETPCECLQVTYLPANKNNVLLLFPREILILDMDIGHAVGSFSIEPSSPSFSMVFPCSQRDILFLLHENGSISMRAVRSPDRLPYQYDYDEPEKILSSRISLDVLYEIKCHSDVFRLSRTSRLMGFCVDPVSECNTAVLLADGRILFWSLTVQGGEIPCFTDSVETEGLLNLQETVKVMSDATFYSLDKIIPPLLSFGEDKHKLKYKKPRFLLHGLYEGIAQSPVCAKMCPPMTTKNFKNYEALVAVACNNGTLQIFNACTGILKKLFSLGCHNLNGLEWITLTTLLVHCNGGSSKSEIMHIDIVSGVVKTLPGSRGLKESAIASLKVSHQKQYFLVLFKKHGAELWDAVNLCQLREFPSNFPKMTAFEWSPSSYGSRVGRKKTNSSAMISSGNIEQQSSNMLEGKVDETKKVARSKEHLVFTDIDGTVFHYVVEGISLKDGTKVPPETGMGLVSYITWKGDMLVLGDVDGNMNFWDLKAKVSRVAPTHRGIVKRIKFAPGKGNMKMIVLFNDGIEVWDAGEEKSLLSIKSSKDQVLDADWFSSSFPLLLFADGSIRIYNTTLKTTNSPISDKELDEKIFNPRLLDVSSAMKLKHILQHQPWREKYDAEHFSDERSERLIQDQMDVIPRDVLGLLYNCPFGTAERSAYVAQIYGDESDYIFWKVALHYLKGEKVKKTCPHHQLKVKDDSRQITPRSTSPTNSYDDFLLPSEDEDSDDSGLSLEPCTCLKSSLDTKFDILCDNQFYKKVQIYHVALCDSHRASYEHTRQCAEKLILLGEMDRAVQILLEGEPADSSYYTDALRACLIATVKSSGASQSTIKLVATNLIASGKLTEGVELLCLVDKGTDACRYLQTYGNWDLATWLAKVRLNNHDSSEVITRWCDHLCATNKKADAILILLSLGKFIKVLDLMFGLGQTDRAVLFLEACIEFEALSLSDEVNQILFENIFLDYARLQIKLEHRVAFEYYCMKAGGRGRKLMEEHKRPQASTPTNTSIPASPTTPTTPPATATDITTASVTTTADSPSSSETITTTSPTTAIA